MKLQSRPEEEPAGTGPYALRMEYEELQYIGALLYITRLGQGPYKDAAFKLLSTLEEALGDEFIEEAAEQVDLSISVVDDDDAIKEQHHCSCICIEV